MDSIAFTGTTSTNYSKQIPTELHNGCLYLCSSTFPRFPLACIANTAQLYLSRETHRHNSYANGSCLVLKITRYRLNQSDCLVPIKLLCPFPLAFMLNGC